MEEWKAISIEGLPEGMIEITKEGKVRNIITGKELKPYIARQSNSGYYRLTLSYKGVRKTPLLHRLIALAFIPNPNNKEQVNHIDGNKSNNDLSNLEWVTNMENIRHAMKIGRHKPWIKTQNRLTAGHKAGVSRRKLSTEDIRTIRGMHRNGGYTQQQLANQFKIARSSISEILSGNYYSGIV